MWIGRRSVLINTRIFFEFCDGLIIFRQAELFSCGFTSVVAAGAENDFGSCGHSDRKNSQINCENKLSGSRKTKCLVPVKTPCSPKGFFQEYFYFDSARKGLYQPHQSMLPPEMPRAQTHITARQEHRRAKFHQNKRAWMIAMHDIIIITKKSDYRISYFGFRFQGFDFRV